MISKREVTSLQESAYTTLLQRWERFVTQVEIGYRSTIYDFTNEVSVRTMLDTSSYPDVQAQITLSALDDRYKAATREVSAHLRVGRPQDAWWAHRIPLIIVGELEQDFRLEGLI